jgi:hypothetical protein
MEAPRQNSKCGGASQHRHAKTLQPSATPLSGPSTKFRRIAKQACAGQRQLPMQDHLRAKTPKIGCEGEKCGAKKRHAPGQRGEKVALRGGTREMTQAFEPLPQQREDDDTGDDGCKKQRRNDKPQLRVSAV